MLRLSDRAERCCADDRDAAHAALAASLPGGPPTALHSITNGPTSAASSARMIAMANPSNVVCNGLLPRRTRWPAAPRSIQKMYLFLPAGGGNSMSQGLVERI